MSLKMDIKRYTVENDTHVLFLSSQLYPILDILLKNEGYPVHSERLIQRSSCASNNSLCVQIHNLRKKLKPMGYNIYTQWDIGYILSKSNPELEKHLSKERVKI